MSTRRAKMMEVVLCDDLQERLRRLEHLAVERWRHDEAQRRLREIKSDRERREQFRERQQKYFGQCWFDQDAYLRACERFGVPFHFSGLLPMTAHETAWWLAFYATGTSWHGATVFPLVRRVNKWVQEHTPPLPEAFAAPEILGDVK